MLSLDYYKVIGVAMLTAGKKCFFVVGFSFLTIVSFIIGPGSANADNNEHEFKVECNPPSGAARALEAYATKVLMDKGAASVKVSVRIKAKSVNILKLSDMPASLISTDSESLSFRAAPSSIFPDGALGVSCAGEYEATITASGIINNKVMKGVKSTVKLKL